MNYNRLIFHEDLWPDVIGRTLTFNCKRYELELKTIEGIRSCCISMAECIAFRSRFELSHIDTRAAEYHPSFGAMVLDNISRYLKLYSGRKPVKETHGCNGLPPFLQWMFSPVIARMHMRTIGIKDAEVKLGEGAKPRIQHGKLLHIEDASRINRFFFKKTKK